jgi:excisionase family DNA binding protein
MVADKELLTIKEVAELLDLSTRTVERKIKEGIIPAFRLPEGRRIYVKRADLLAALEPVAVEEEDGDATPAGGV